MCSSPPEQHLGYCLGNEQMLISLVAQELNPISSVDCLLSKWPWIFLSGAELVLPVHPLVYHGDIA